MNCDSHSLEKMHLFTESGLIFDKSFLFHNKNLLIGKNGAGKTRFLKSLETYYNENKSENTTVLTLYFPEINLNSDEQYPIELYDAIFEKEKIGHGDFLKIASKDCIFLIEDIYNSMSIRATKAQKRMQQDFQRLNKYFNDLFGAELNSQRNNGDITIIKHIKGTLDRQVLIEQAIKEFSPGELMLFYVSILIFYLDHLTDKELILIIDEPELHLHPKALVAFMEMLMNSKAISQLWVASHSLFIMPLFPFEQIVHFDQNHIRPLNRHTYEEIYDELIGFENVDAYELLRSVENWSYYQFITECFFLPNSVDSKNKKDEQIEKFLNSLKNLQKDQPLNVLDFGAGKFRLWECVKQMISCEEDRNKLLKYDAYEPNLDSEIPDDIDFFENEKDLKENYYDAVVLMNVLHEIDPFEWIDTFKTIKRVLKKTGILVFLEVVSLTNGEQPYCKSGFLLLQEPQVKELFVNSYSVEHDLEGSKKSNCWIITPEDLSNVTFSGVVSTIKSLELYCERLLKELDDERIKLAQSNTKNEYKKKISARRYAFLSQQYINAHFAYMRLQKKDMTNSNTSKSQSTESKKTFPGIIYK